MEDLELKQFLISEGYLFITVISNRGLCGIDNSLFFYTRLCYGFDRWGMRGCYDYNTRFEAIEALSLWDGTGDPPGNWVRHIGRSGDYDNPNYSSVNHE